MLRCLGQKIRFLVFGDKECLTGGEKNCGRIVEKNGVCGRGGTMLRNMINNIKKSVCKANEDFIFGTEFCGQNGME